MWARMFVHSVPDEGILRFGLMVNSIGVIAKGSACNAVEVKYFTRTAIAEYFHGAPA